MSLRIVKPRFEEEPLSLEELLAHFGPEHFNKIEATVKIMREEYQCPYTVKNYDEFKSETFNYFAHYQKTFFNADWNTAGTDHEFKKNFAYDFVAKNLSSYQGGIHRAESNAIKGRDGGLVAIIDALTEAIAKSHVESYIRSVFFDLVPASDYPLRMRLAEELLKKYGQHLFPGEQLLPRSVDHQCDGVLGDRNDHVFGAPVPGA